MLFYHIRKGYTITLRNIFQEVSVLIDYTTIGKRIKELRMQKHLTQAVLAEMSGIEPSNISHIERAATKLSLPTLVSIANALSMTVDALLCDSIEQSKDSYKSEAQAILDGCTINEVRILTETMKNTLSTLRKHCKPQ